MPKPNRERLKLVVWNHFKKRKVDGKDKSECNYCTRLLVRGSKNGTKHLHDHLKICPRKKCKDIRDMKQKILVRDQHNVDSMVGVNAYHFDQDESRKELARMIILHEYPLSIVDHIGFRRYSTSLQPLFKMVSRNTINNDIMSIYDHEREKSMHEIEKNQSRISITTNMWTSQNKKRGFMVVTAHFIDDFWRLQSRVMRFIYVPSPHTKEVISDVLLQTLLEWNIDRKLSTMTVDNCNTNDAVINIILDKLQRSTLVMRGSMLHMRCAAHVLNLIVQDGLNVIGSCIEKVRESVGFWTGSTKRRQRFTDTARQLHVECTKELALDCKTCWNSTYLMLSTAIEYRDVFFRLSQRESSYKCIPKEEEWEMASSICERLALFYKVTKLFSGTLYPTANLFFPKVCEIKIALNSWFISPSDIIRSMAFKMLEKFDCYWNAIHGVMVVATILDPRYKIELLEYYFPLIYGDEAENEIQRVRDTCYEMICDYTSGRMGREGSCQESQESIYLERVWCNPYSLKGTQGYGLQNFASCPQPVKWGKSEPNSGQWPLDTLDSLHVSVLDTCRPSNVSSGHWTEARSVSDDEDDDDDEILSNPSTGSQNDKSKLTSAVKYSNAC
ncbi:hypothetical protein SO802_033552 [Lithocarpus litseifolius]|uniref:BED-type domain-containing protein n=1 Tax=Lithocarpus litseifolius TaxID=425828 RepID=A0AAW2BDX9_9ROSI